MNVLNTHREVALPSSVSLVIMLLLTVLGGPPTALQTVWGIGGPRSATDCPQGGLFVAGGLSVYYHGRLGAKHGGTIIM